MALPFSSRFHDPEVWHQALAVHLPDLDMRVWPEAGDPAAIDVALIWEPLPAGHSFWDHPKVTVTPHNASDPHPRWVSGSIAECLRRARAGEELMNVVDMSRGY